MQRLMMVHVIPIIEGCLQEDADNYSTSNGNVQIDVNTNNEALCIYYGCVDDNFL